MILSWKQIVRLHLAIQNPSPDMSISGSIVGDCILYLKSIQNVTFRFTRRSANLTAHLLGSPGSGLIWTCLSEDCISLSPFLASMVQMLLDSVHSVMIFQCTTRLVIHLKRFYIIDVQYFLTTPRLLRCLLNCLLLQVWRSTSTVWRFTEKSQLDNNNFHGAVIPVVYGNLSRLVKLSLRNCSLQGPLPNFSKLSSLKYLMSYTNYKLSATWARRITKLLSAVEEEKKEVVAKPVPEPEKTTEAASVQPPKAVECDEGEDEDGGPKRSFVI
ncbi:hypothetical protein POM88_007671 [Heracleum sosnowskyi]|uniref:Uncharacterized protein n=1 Tax=Heracleum sosnowskyi TaxID=360622 RepID=A0AAD8J5W0_9APIA|nr:hypothetical protein POM88_007671 [Heracleum sosnowskyi]